MIKGRCNFLFVGIVAAAFSFLSLADIASSEIVLTREQVLENAETTENLLKKYHPNLYAHRTPKQIRSIWNKAESQLPDNPNILDAATLIQQMLAAVCDEHTLIRPNEYWISRFFPMGLVMLEDKLYLDDVQFDRKIREVVSINKRNSKEIITFLKSITSVDGCQNSDVLFSHHVNRRMRISILMTNFLGQRAHFDVTYRNTETGAITTSRLLSVNLSALERLSRHRSIYGRSYPLKSLGIEIKERDWRFSGGMARRILVRSDAKKSIFYIYLPNFDGGGAQAEAIDKEMRELVKAKPDNVIVDLTDNSGGSHFNAMNFSSYFLRTSNRTGVAMRSRIKKNVSDSNYIWRSKYDREKYSKYIRQFRKARKKRGQYQLIEGFKTYGNKSYRGNLTILVSPITGSAATTVATILKRKAGAKIVGDIGDASMTTRCSGSPGAHRLPISRIPIVMPFDCSDRHPGAKRKGNLLKPDVPVDIAAYNSSNTNAAILKAAIRSLDLE